MIANGDYMKKLCDYGEVLTVKDVQNILGIGRNAVYTMLKNGTLKSKRIGTKYIIPKKSIQTYLNSCFLAKNLERANCKWYYYISYGWLFRKGK